MCSNDAHEHDEDLSERTNHDVPPEPLGIRCPSCHDPISYVLQTRRRPFGRVWRRRECRSCGHMYSTREVIDEGPGIHRKRR